MSRRAGRRHPPATGGGTSTLIVMLSSMTDEPRVLRESATLAGAGYEVELLGARMTGDEAHRETVQGHRTRRVDLVDMAAVRLLKRALRRGRPAEPAADAGTPAAASPAGGPAPGGPVRPNRLADLRNIVHLVVSALSFGVSIARRRPDVYHCHDIAPLAPSLLLARLRRRPLVYESHEYWMAKLPGQPVSHRLMIAVERYACRRADAVIAVNDSIAELMVADYGIARPHVVINVPATAPVPTPSAAGPATEPLRLLYHGIYTDGRGLDRLIEAVARVERPVRLTLRGRGEAEGSLRALVDRLGVGDRVTFVEAVPMVELVPRAAEHEVGLLPFENRFGYHLALPNKLFEYMAAGLAILATDLPELTRVIDESGCGRTCDGSVERLAEAIEAMAADRSLVAEQRRRSHEAAVRRYNWPAQEHTLLEAYRRAEADRRR